MWRLFLSWKSQQSLISHLLDPIGTSVNLSLSMSQWHCTSIVGIPSCQTHLRPPTARLVVWFYSVWIILFEFILIQFVLTWIIPFERLNAPWHRLYPIKFLRGLHTIVKSYLIFVSKSTVQLVWCYLQPMDISNETTPLWSSCSHPWPIIRTRWGKEFFPQVSPI